MGLLTVGVDNGDDVEIVRVQDCLDRRVRAVAGNQLIQDVFGNLKNAVSY